MDRPIVVIPIVIIVNSCLWGFAMIMTSRALSGSGGYAAIQGVLAGCAAASLIVVGGGLAGLATKVKRDQ